MVLIISELGDRVRGGRGADRPGADRPVLSDSMSECCHAAVAAPVKMRLLEHWGNLNAAGT